MRSAWIPTFLSFGFALTLLLISPRSADAQCVLCGDFEPPTITFEPPTGTTFFEASVELEISACDNESFPGLVYVKVNGQDVTSSFTQGGSVSGCFNGNLATGTITLSEGSNVVEARFCDNSSNCGTSQASYTLDDRRAPLLDLGFHNGDNLDMRRCVLDCLDGVVSYTTPAYFSRDRARAVTLMHRSEQAAPRGLVVVEATDQSAEAPEMMSIRLRVLRW